MMTDAELRVVNRGSVVAILRCGAYAPASATLVELDEAADRAAREVDRAIECWQRWRRRFNPGPDRLEVGSGRTNIRHGVALFIATQRVEVLQALIGPAQGSA
jgi:hypothetical protein